MYDMYPWNDPDSGANHHEQDGPAPGNGARPVNGVRTVDGTRPVNGAEPRGVPAGFAQAVQVALDRRDNGGDAVAAGQPTASLTRQ